MAALKIATVIGARPQFIKAGAVSRVIAGRDDVAEVLIHTGQHFDDAMSAVFFRELDLPEPSYNLNVVSQSHGQMTGRMLEQVEAVLCEERPDLVLVYGDTNSTLAGALAASKLNIPIAHIEAGLRSFNRRMPEEVNRVVTDHISSIQLCPTQASVENLRREGIVENVHHTGDVMFDATLFTINGAARHSAVISRLGLTRGQYAVCTVHRAENTDDPARLMALASYLRTIGTQQTLVLPLHPRTRGALARHEIDLGPVVMIEPLGYVDLQALVAGAAIVYTDSGGLQKEAYFHGKPCVTLRDETEWVETISHGWNRLWYHTDFVEPRLPIADYGEGNAAGKIVNLLCEYLGSGKAAQSAS